MSSFYFSFLSSFSSNDFFELSIWEILSDLDKIYFSSFSTSLASYSFSNSITLAFKNRFVAVVVVVSSLQLWSTKAFLCIFKLIIKPALFIIWTSTKSNTNSPFYQCHTLSKGINLALFCKCQYLHHVSPSNNIPNRISRMINNIQITLSQTLF